MTMGLIIPSVTDATNEFEWLDIGKQLADVDREFAVAWAFHVGHWLQNGDQKWGEMYSQGLELFDREYTTLTNYKWLAGRYTLEEVAIYTNLSLRHFQRAAKFEDRLLMLDTAQSEGWGAAEMMRELKGESMPALPPDTPMPGDIEYGLLVDNGALQKKYDEANARLALVATRIDKARQLLPALRTAVVDGDYLGAMGELSALEQTFEAVETEDVEIKAWVEVLHYFREGNWLAVEKLLMELV